MEVNAGRAKLLELVALYIGRLGRGAAVGRCRLTL